MKLAPHNDEVLRQNFNVIEMSDKLNYKLNKDLEITNNRLILNSPNGTKYAVTVNNLGVLSAVAI